MKRRTTLLSALFVALLALPVVAQVNDTYVIPAAINQAGAFGANWKTQFSVFNPQLNHDLNIRVTFVATGGAADKSKTATIPVGANAIRYSDNILDDLFGVTGSGSLLVATFADDNPGVPNTVLDQSFLVTTNTYNDLRTGTYGQTIPGVWTGLQDFSTDEISGVVHGIRNSAKEGWRTNIGAVNLGRCNARLLINVYDENGGKIVNNAAFDLPPMGHFQDRLEFVKDIHGNPLTELARGTIEFFVDDPCVGNADNAAVVFPYTSTVDQLSGDPAYQSPVLLASPSTIYKQKAAAKTDLATAQLTIGKRVSKATIKAIADQAVDLGVIELKSGTSHRTIR